MTISSIGPRELASLGAAKTDDPTKTERDRAQAGKDFEAILLRKMLSSLEKTAHVAGGKGGLSAGNETYGTMIVDGLADAIAASGGLGLAKIIEEQLAQQQKQGKAAQPPEGETNSPKGLAPTTAPHGGRLEV